MPSRPGQTGTPSKGGFAVFTVLAILFILSFLFFTLHQNSIRLRRTTVNLLEEEFARNVGHAIGQIVWVYLEDVFRRRSGSPLLFPGNPTASPLHLQAGGDPHGTVVRIDDLEKKTQLWEDVEKLVAELPGARFVDAEAKLLVKKRYGNAAYGRIELKIQLAIGRTPYEMVFPREFKLVNVLPPATSKFTLFVRTAPDPEMYNIVRKGFQEDSGPQRVLTLNNTERPFLSTDHDAWLKSGWVFLGGARNVLNLDGTHPCRNESEFFLFWPSLYFGPTNQTAELPYACSPCLGSTKLRVRFTPIGAMGDWTGSPKLKTVIGQAMAPRVETSSILRLFGSKATMTPTRVLGNVLGRYVLYSTLIFDANTDTIADILLDAAGTQQKAIFPLPRLVNPGDYFPPFAPRMINSRGYDLFIDGLGLAGLPTSLLDVMPAFNAGSANDYVTFMTKVSTDFSAGSGFAAFNTLYDHLFDGATIGVNKRFPAPRLLTPAGSAGEYPNDGRNVTIPADPSGNGSIFTGDLTTLDPAVHLRGTLQEICYRFPSEGEWLDSGLCQRQGQALRFRRPAVCLVEGDLNLTQPVEAYAPVVLAATGKIKVGKVERKVPAARVVLYSLGGDIETTGGRLEAALLAPNGTLRPGAPLDLNGILCVNSIDPAALAAHGGTILYDRSLDPSDPQRFLEGYTIVLGPDSTATLKR